MASRHADIYERAVSRLKLKQLNLLVAVARHASIQHAARALGMSQPAATTLIQDIETDFGVQLFERTNRGTVPTPSGEALIRHVKVMLAQLASATQELDDLTHGRRGRVVVGTTLAASSRLLPLAIDTVLQARPQVTITLVEGTNDILMPALRAAEIDLVVGRLSTYRQRDGTVQESLFDEPMLALVGPNHPLAGTPSVKFDDLRPYGWIIPPVDTTLRRQIDTFFLQNGSYAPPQAVESLSYLTNRMLVQARDLIAIMPAQVAALDVAHGVLSALSWQVPFGEGPVGVTTRADGALSQTATAFLHTLRAVAQDL